MRSNSKTETGFVLPAEQTVTLGTPGYIKLNEDTQQHDAKPRSYAELNPELENDDSKPAAAKSYFNSTALNGTEVVKIDMHDYRRLLGKVLGTLDMALANKQQHTAATRSVREAFDATYNQMMDLTYPDSNCASSDSNGYAVSPR